jgi:hypothetical protein
MRWPETAWKSSNSSDLFRIWVRKSRRASLDWFSFAREKPE